MADTTATVKKNVSEFNSDVLANEGYRYTSNAPYSSVVSNKRITDETEKLLKKIGNVKAVIDIGCGDGTYTAELKQRLPDIAFTGFDPASEAIGLAQKKYPACSFIVGNVLDVTTFPERKFDVAVIRGVIHHLPTQSEAIKNAALLSNRIIIIEPNGNNPILKWIEKNSEYHIQHEEQSFTSSFLQKICADNGLQIKHLSFIGFVPFFFPEFPSKLIYFFQPLLEKIPFLGKYFGAQTVILAEK
ncbi:MAG: methyltransferase domain-containing protein [Chitinophagales bacterium]|nr:methyltransferase domain-containing protein [Chitinophagales bacterium]